MALRSLRKEFGVAIGASETAIRINTDEIDDCLKTLTEVAKDKGWELRVWDHTMGTVWYNGEPPPKQETKAPPGLPGSLAEALTSVPACAPPSPLQEVVKFLQEFPRPDPASEGDVLPVILVMKNFHLAFDRDRGPLVSAIQHLVADKVCDHPNYKEFKAVMDSHGVEQEADTGKFLIGIMPAEANLPAEVRPLFKVIDHELPNEEELLAILDGVLPAKEAGEQFDLPQEVRRKVSKFALGLTRLQAEGVFTACIVQFGKKKNFVELLPKYVWEHKSSILNKEGLVTLYDGRETFDDVVGQKGLKELITELLQADEFDPDNPDLKSKGLALVGPPRTGKSMTAKAAGPTLGLPALMVDVGSWMGSYVGDTEKNTRKGFQIIRAHAPCIAIIDEVEKVMPSAKGGEHDSGVGKRMAGTFMTNMQDIQEPIFWVFTANGVEDLHEAFLDDDRIDAKVYVKMPGPEQRAEAWKKLITKFFPKEVKGAAFPRALETNFDVVLDALKKAKKVDPVAWANRLIPALLCLHGEEREAALGRVRDADDNVAQTVDKLMVDDDGWTIARIKSVCRLARKRKRSLSDIAKMMPRRQSIRLKAINRLEKWATEEAVDAETGVAYVPPGEEEDEEGDEAHGLNGRKKVHHKTKVRRKVRKFREADEE